MNRLLTAPMRLLREGAGVLSIFGSASLLKRVRGELIGFLQNSGIPQSSYRSAAYYQASFDKDLITIGYSGMDGRRTSETFFEDSIARGIAYGSTSYSFIQELGLSDVHATAQLMAALVDPSLEESATLDRFARLGQHVFGQLLMPADERTFGQVSALVDNVGLIVSAADDYPWPGDRGLFEAAFSRLARPVLDALAAQQPLDELTVHTTITLALWNQWGAIIADVKGQIESRQHEEARDATNRTLAITAVVSLVTFGVGGAVVGAIGGAVSKFATSQISQEAHDQISALATAAQSDFPAFAAEVRRVQALLAVQSGIPSSSTSVSDGGAQTSVTAGTSAGRALSSLPSAGSPQSLFDRIIAFIRSLLGGLGNGG